MYKTCIEKENEWFYTGKQAKKKLPRVNIKK
jgi:hypothetical protein